MKMGDCGGGGFWLCVHASYSRDSKFNFLNTL